jgi:hypothetical protein
MRVYVGGILDGSTPYGVFSDFEIAVRQLCWMLIPPRCEDETLTWTVHFLDGDVRDREAILRWTAELPPNSDGLIRTLYIESYEVETAIPPMSDDDGVTQPAMTVSRHG